MKSFKKQKIYIKVSQVPHKKLVVVVFADVIFFILRRNMHRFPRFYLALVLTLVALPLSQLFIIIAIDFLFFMTDVYQDHSNKKFRPINCDDELVNYLWF